MRCRYFKSRKRYIKKFRAFISTIFDQSGTQRVSTTQLWTVTTTKMQTDAHKRSILYPLDRWIDSNRRLKHSLYILSCLYGSIRDLCPASELDRSYNFVCMRNCQTRPQIMTHSHYMHTHTERPPAGAPKLHSLNEIIPVIHFILKGFQKPPASIWSSRSRWGETIQVDDMGLTQKKKNLIITYEARFSIVVLLIRRKLKSDASVCVSLPRYNL